VQQRREPARCVLLHRGQHIAVRVERDRDVLVAEATLHHVCRDARGEQQSCASVSQSVHRDPLHASGGAKALELLTHGHLV